MSSAAMPSSTSERMSYWRLVALLAAATLVMAALSLAVGYARLDLVAALSDWLAGRQSLPALVLVELRLPRAILGALVTPAEPDEARAG